MSTNNSTYAPSEVVMVVSHELFGNHVIVGYSANEMVTLSRTNPTWTHETSPDNFHTRIHNKDRSATAALTLVQTSPSNDVMHMIAQYDESQLSDDGLFAITIADKKGRSVATSTSAYVSVPQEQAYGRELNSRVWNITLMDYDEHIGGNGKLSAEIIAILDQFGYSVDDQWR